MDDLTKPEGSGNPAPGDEGMTRRMDVPPDVPPTPPSYGTPPAPTQPMGAAPGGYTPPNQYNPPGGYTPPNQYNPPGGYTPPAPDPAPAPYAPGGYTPPNQYAPPAPDPAPTGYTPPGPNTPQPYQAAQPVQYNNPPPGYTAPGQYVPAAAGAGLSGYAANPPVKDPTMATVIEIVAGLFGFLGVGHMLTGRLVPGIILLASWLIVGIPLIWLGLPLVTCGFGFCLSPFLWIAAPIISGLYLRGQMLGKPLFSR